MLQLCHEAAHTLGARLRAPRCLCVHMHKSDLLRATVTRESTARGAFPLTPHACLRTQVFGRLFSKKEMRILMVGLDAAGKTTILYKLKVWCKLMNTLCTKSQNRTMIVYFCTKSHIFFMSSLVELCM